MHAEAHNPQYCPPEQPILRLVFKEGIEEDHGEPISKTWRPIDEASFLQNNPQLSPAQANVYLRRSAESFLLEHSFEAPFSFFVGQLAPDGHMDIQGTDMSTSWIRTRQRYGIGSNEEYETQGYEKAHEMLRAGAQGAILSSPQKPGVDRRFHFVLTKGLPFGSGYDYVSTDDPDGEWFTQINLMHKGARLPFERAREDYSALERLAGMQDTHGESIQSNRDMLVRPIMLMDTSKEVLDRVLATVGIGEVEISRSYERQKVASSDPQISDDLTAYINTVKKLARFDLQNLGPIGTEVLKDAEALRNGIYIRANELYARYKDRTEERDSWVLHEELAFMTQAQRIAYLREREDPMIYGGISCATTASSNSIWQGLQDGQSMSGLLGEMRILCCTCPHCGKEVDAQISGGKIHCPKCKATANWKD